LRRNAKAVILLSAGHIIYSIAGLLAGKSLLWMFTEIPYQVKSVYGNGDFMHYPNQMLLTLGIPVFMLACAGFVVLILDILKVKIPSLEKNKLEVRLLILGSFLAYFLFHTFSWWLGLFGSMGMSRVLIAMVPLLSVIAIYGFNFLTRWKIQWKFPVQIVLTVLLIVYVLVFPFLHNPASINWEKELRRSPEMNLMHTIAVDINKHKQNRFLYYSNPYFSYALGINPFDRSKHLCFTDWQAEKRLKPNSLVIWDNWFSVTEERTDSLALFQNPELKLISRYETQGDKAKNIFLVFGN
jgi:glycerol-3-phosphate acyltransferase PlsY